VSTACTSAGNDLTDSSSRDTAPAISSGLPSTDDNEASLPTIGGGTSDTVNFPTTSTVTSTTTTTLRQTTTLPASTTSTTLAIEAPIPGDILFAFGSAVLRPEAVDVLAPLVDELLENFPYSQVELVGHTDSRGSESYNLDLSQRRAEAVLQVFVDSGFNSAQLSARGAGESEPLVSDTDDQGNFLPDAGALNRRVEIDITT
jgi:outer membrane protein OmpA-like peptidoglycan-associated protein